MVDEKHWKQLRQQGVKQEEQRNGEPQ